jgi:hypothetical protein
LEAYLSHQLTGSFAVELTVASTEKITAAALDRSRVKGATHQFYRYPARFSPEFVRACVEEFSSPGDLVFDPFVGGGTTLVEAMLSGRVAVGTDLNALACFVSKAKTTRLTKADIAHISEWYQEIAPTLKVGKKKGDPTGWAEAGYFKNLDSSETWRCKQVVQAAIDEIARLKNKRCEQFARCAILRTAQLAFDGRKTIPSVSELRKKLDLNFSEMLISAAEFSEALDKRERSTKAHVIQSSASLAHELPVFEALGRPKLIVTSPPYPGLHVLYHRWQVKGRRETPLPYWIANKLDGDGERYYTLGNRHENELKGYFSNLELSFKAIAKVADQHTTIVQMIAFSEPEWQLPRYLEVMERCGLVELIPPLAHDNETTARRLWRDVPNRKWHASLQAQKSGSRELVLFHKLA